MKKLSKKMMISLLTFALVFIALGASTFAWFTLADSAQVTDVQINVSSGTGLEIALEEDGVYKSKWTTSELEEFIGDITLSDLNSTDGVNFKNFAKEDVVFETGENKVNSFIEITFYFKGQPSVSNVENVGVYLINHQKTATFNNKPNNGTFLVSKGVESKADAAYTDINGSSVAVDATQKYFAANATMVSFQDNGLASNNVKLYDFNAVAGSNYNDGFATDAGTNGANLKGAASYYYHKNEVNPGVGATRLTPSGELTTFTNTSNVDQPDNQNSLICTMTPESEGSRIYKGSVKIRIWVEGFDADCFNSILADIIVTQFEFKLGYTIKEGN